MRKPLLAALTVALMLGACGKVRDSRLNPLNWFGRSSEQTLTEAYIAPEVQDPRPLMQQITAMRVEPTPGGAIVHATGLPPQQGYWETDLLSLNDGKPNENGVLVFQFRANGPIAQTATGTPYSREVTAATFLTNQALAGVRTIVVQGAQNQRSASR